MSYTSLLFFKDNKIVDEIEYRNASGGMGRIYDSMWKAHLIPKKQYEIWYHRTDEIIDLCNKDGIHDTAKAAVLFCCDRAVVRKNEFNKFAADLLAFDQAYPYESTWSNHLKGWAKDIVGSDYDAVSLYAHSVVENPWYYWDDEEESSKQHSLTECQFFLYDQLKKQ